MIEGSMVEYAVELSDRFTFALKIPRLQNWISKWMKSHAKGRQNELFYLLCKPYEEYWIW